MSMHVASHGLPPVLIQMGELKIMKNDAVRLAARLTENRVRVTLEVWRGLYHVVQHYAAILPNGEDILGNAASFLARAFGEGGTGHERRRPV